MHVLSLKDTGLPGRVVASWNPQSPVHTTVTNSQLQPPVSGPQALSQKSGVFEQPFSQFVQEYKDPVKRSAILHSLRQSGDAFQEKRFLRAMDQILPKISKAKSRVNQQHPALLTEGSVKDVFRTILGTDPEKEFTTSPAKKSFWDKIPPILSLTANDYTSGFATPFATFAVGAMAASLAYFFPGLFNDTLPKLSTGFDTAWILKMFGFTVFCTYLMTGWKNFFGEIFPKNYQVKSRYLTPAGKAKKYLGLQVNEGLVGVQISALEDLKKRSRIFDVVKSKLGNLPFVGKFVKTLPETSGEIFAFATDIALNIFATAAFLFIMKGADFKLLPALMPSAILTLFNCVGTTYITKSIQDSPGKIVAFRQILGIALFVFAAMTSTEFNGEFVMHPALMAGSQVLAGAALLAGVGTLVKPKT